MHMSLRPVSACQRIGWFASGDPESEFDRHSGVERKLDGQKTEFNWLPSRATIELSWSAPELSCWTTLAVLGCAPEFRSGIQTNGNSFSYGVNCSSVAKRVYKSNTFYTAF